MAEETSPSVGVAEEGIEKKVLGVIEKKIRNLEKRKGRLEAVAKDIEMGKEVTESQREALGKKNEVERALELTKELLTSAEAKIQDEMALLEQKAKRELKEQSMRTLETLANVMRLQFLLREGLLREEIGDNELLETLKAEAEKAERKNFKNAARFWLKVLDAAPKEFAQGVTFEAAHKKLTGIGDFLDKLNRVASVPDDEGNIPASGANGRGDSPVASSMGDSDTGAMMDNGHGSALRATGRQHDELSISPVEDVTLNHDIDSEQLATQLTNVQNAGHLAQTQPNAQPVQSTAHVVVSNPPQAAVAAAATPIDPAQHHQVFIPGVAMLLSPVPQQPAAGDEDAIQFGSVEHVVHPQVAVATEAYPAVRPASPNQIIGMKEFDFIQDDLTVTVPPPSAAVHPAGHPISIHPAGVHMDPAVVRAGASVGPYNAHFQQIVQMQQQPHHPQSHHQIPQQHVQPTGTNPQQQARQQDQGQENTGSNNNNNNNEQQQSQQQPAQHYDSQQRKELNNKDSHHRKGGDNENVSNNNNNNTNNNNNNSSNNHNNNGRNNRERSSPQDQHRYQDGGKPYHHRNNFNANKGGYPNGWNGGNRSHWNSTGPGGRGGDRYINSGYGGGNPGGPRNSYNRNGAPGLQRREPQAQRV